jgi:enamine deaminase RidA (YjgF/YER057c/UK114 family)
MVSGEGTRPAGAEQRLKELGITLPAPPEPFGTYVEAVQTGNLLFLSGMLPTEGHGARFTGRIGAELDVAAGRQAAHLASLGEYDGRGLVQGRLTRHTHSCWRE